MRHLEKTGNINKTVVAAAVSAAEGDAALDGRQFLNHAHGQATPGAENGWLRAMFPRFLFLSWVVPAFALAASVKVPEDAVIAQPFVEQAQIVSRCPQELYAHQSSLRIVKGTGYAVYQCNEKTPEENKEGQIARLAIFDLQRPAETARWVDIAVPGESSGGITITGRFVSAPMLHRLNDDTLRIFFCSRGAGDANASSRVYFKDYTISTGALSELRQVRCTIAAQPERQRDLEEKAVQEHLDFLFGAGFGAQFAKGISTACDFVEADGQLYSTIQIKNSENGKTRLLTNVLMRSHDQGATWELLGAPDPRLLPGEIKILAEPALTVDAERIYLHLRSNVATTGYVLSKAAKADPYHFDAPVTKWTFGIGRPTLVDLGVPIGLVAMFTAPTVPTGPQTVTRNKCDVVCIDPTYTHYTKAFAVFDANAVNTPFLVRAGDDVYATYSTGRRHLLSKFGTSEIVFGKLPRAWFGEGR